MEDKPGYYAVIPAKVRYDPELRPNAKLLYGEITTLANARGYCTAQNETLGQYYELSGKTVSSLISNLAKKGYIRVEIIRDAATQRVTERRIWVDVPKLQEPVPDFEGRSPQNRGDPPLKNEAENTTSKNTIPPITPRGDVQPSQMNMLFDRFWSAYPRKANKLRAKKAWDKLKPSMETCRVMAAALERFKASDMWRRDGGAYIPHAATWLNNRRWEDEDIDTKDGGDDNGKFAGLAI